jgi:hypothetical protein
MNCNDGSKGDCKLPFRRGVTERRFGTPIVTYWDNVGILEMGGEVDEEENKAGHA